MLKKKPNKAELYLLGNLSEQELAQLEAEFLANDELFEELDSFENDLTDAYVRGELSRTEREQFEKLYLTSPDRREKVKFAKQWRNYLAQMRTKEGASQPGLARKQPSLWAVVPPRSLPFRLAFAVIIAALLLSSAWLVIINRELHNEIKQAHTQTEQLLQQEQGLHDQAARLEARLQDHPSAAVPEKITHARSPETTAWLLMPGLSRESSPQKNIAIQGQTPVRLDLYLERDEYSSYRASLETVEGSPLWKKSNLKTHATPQGHRVITLTIPTSILGGGDYIIDLIGTSPQSVPEDAGAYSFRVTRR